MQRTKSQFNRLLELDRHIRSGSYPNCITFASEWEVAQKTIQRDIEYLRDSLGAPIEYDREKKGYYYTDTTWFLPSLTLSEGDLFYLMLASKVLEQYRGTPVAAHVEKVFAKVAESLPEKIAIKPEWVFSHFSFTQPPAKPVDHAIWETTVRGLLHRRSVRILYRSMESGKNKERVIDPYHMANLQGEWYVFAWCHREKMVIQFAIPRMKSAVLTSATFEEPKDFDPQKILSSTFGRFALSDKPQTVRLLFDKEVAPWVLEREWSPRQKVAKRKNGDIELSFPAAGLFEVFRWVLSWGRHVKAIGPEELKRMVRTEQCLA
jgi:predicted DNA-binding transcriptional regulator YafY